MSEAVFEADGSRITVKENMLNITEKFRKKNQEKSFETGSDMIYCKGRHMESGVFRFPC